MKLGYQCRSWHAWCWAGWFLIVAWALSGKQRLWTNYAPFFQTQIPCSCSWSTCLLTGTKPQPDRGLPLKHSSMLTVPPIRIGRCNFLAKSIWWIALFAVRFSLSYFSCSYCACSLASLACPLNLLISSWNVPRNWFFSIWKVKIFIFFFPSTYTLFHCLNWTAMGSWSINSSTAATSLQSSMNLSGFTLTLTSSDFIARSLRDKFWWCWQRHMQRELNDVKIMYFGLLSQNAVLPNFTDFNVRVFCWTLHVDYTCSRSDTSSEPLCHWTSQSQPSLVSCESCRFFPRRQWFFCDLLWHFGRSFLFRMGKLRISSC